jgi:transcriptional regulator of acetoin/glycerol metabolism
MDYPFPGNIRELENIIEFAFVKCKGPVIDLGYLPQDLWAEENEKPGYLSGRELLEAQKIRAILTRCPNRRDEAARALGMSRATLWRKMKKYGIGFPSET